AGPRPTKGKCRRAGARDESSCVTSRTQGRGQRIIADQVRSEAEFEQTEGYPRNRGKLIGYVVTRQFAVKVRDVNGFPKLVDDLISAANAEFTGIEPQLSKSDEVQNQLWDKAVADARQQAEKTTKQAGMKIDSVFAISPVSIPEIESTMFP